MIPRRAIDLTFTLDPSVAPTGFQSGQGNVKKVTGLRVSADIEKLGLDSLNRAQLRVYGLPLSDMNQLSTLGKLIAEGRKNRVTVQAGDAGGAMGTVFDGTIQDAYVDMNGAPDACLLINAMTGLIDALKPVPPLSFKDPVDVATVVSGIAQLMGHRLENNKVTNKLPAGQYLPGSAVAQLRKVCEAADISYIIDDDIVAIWPKGGSRKGAHVVIGPGALVGYPAYTGNGIALTCLYDPNIQFGATVEVKSSLTAACGTWQVYALSCELESETPDGAWFTRFSGGILGHVPVK